MNNMHTATAPADHSRRQSRAWVLTAIASLVLAACGGGGGGGEAGSSQPQQLGVVRVQVNDSFGSAVAGAAVVGPRGTVYTDAQGTALVALDTPSSTATVQVVRPTFVDQSLPATATPGTVATVPVTLVRMRSAAGGSLGTRSGVAPVLDASGQQLSFEIELVVVDGDAAPVQGLGSADFTLLPCVPDAAAQRTLCLRSTGSDVAYTPAAAKPEGLTVVAGMPARPHAAALLLDQSGSMQASDATGARLYASKAFLSALGTDDRALLASFASGAGALIPTTPLTIYGPFRDRVSASNYFPTLDALALLVGGNTPLYDAMDALRKNLVADTTVPVGVARAMVVFTDGADTNCLSATACRERRAASIRDAKADQVRLFAIGLSGSVDVLALGELTQQTGGVMLYADTAQQLLPLYGSIGRLFSMSLPTYRLRWTVRAAAAGAFHSGDTLAGRVQVNAGGTRFDVPFVVGVP